MRVVRTNNDPKVPAWLFHEALQKLGHAPQLVQTDCGTENGIVAGIQAALHNNLNAHRFAPFASN